MVPSSSHLPILWEALMLGSAAAFPLDEVLFCVLGFLSVIDGSIVKTLLDPGVCVKEKKNQ